MLLLLSTILGCLASSSITSEVNMNSGKILTERDLRRFLFADYDMLVRPVTDPNKAIVVYATITPIVIRRLDENDQELVMDSWMSMKWSDEYLKWDPKEFNNITVLRIPHTEIWKPDLSIYTSTDDSRFKISNTLALLYSNGTVMWFPFFQIKSRCLRQEKQEMNYFDCNIRIGSWMYSSNLLHPQLAE
ncbi:acetylcholine receptor subunit alpha-type unc-63, partial [Nephila pilipes]